MISKYALLDGTKRRPFNCGNVHVEWFEDRYAVVLYANAVGTVSAIGYDKDEETWYNIDVEDAVSMIHEGRWKDSHVVSLLTSFKAKRYYDFDHTLYRLDTPLHVPVSVMRALRIGIPVSVDRHTLVGHAFYAPATLYRVDDKWMRGSYSGFFSAFDLDRFCIYDEAIQAYRWREVTKLTMSLLVDRFRMSEMHVDYVRRHGRGVAIGHMDDYEFVYEDGTARLVFDKEAWFVDKVPTVEAAAHKLNGIFRHTYGTYRWMRDTGDGISLVELRVYAQADHVDERVLAEMGQAAMMRPTPITEYEIDSDEVAFFVHGIEIKHRLL